MTDYSDRIKLIVECYNYNFYNDEYCKDCATVDICYNRFYELEVREPNYFEDDDYYE